MRAKGIWGLTALLLGVLAVVPAFGQESRYRNYWEVGGFAGISNYNGDLTYSKTQGFPQSQLGSLKPTAFSGGGFLIYRFHPHMGARVALNYGLIAGDDGFSDVPEREARNLHFITHIVELSATMLYEWKGNDRNYMYRAWLTPYVFAGLAAFYYKPMAYLDKAGLSGLTDLRPLRTEGQTKPYSPVSLAIPFGFGVRKRWNDRWDIRLEVGFRYTFTDYLDDVSGNGNGPGGYARPSEYSSALSATFGDRRLTTAIGDGRRGNPQTNDWYVFSGVAVSYVIYDPNKCPKPNRRNKGKFLFF